LTHRGRSQPKEPQAHEMSCKNNKYLNGNNSLPHLNMIWGSSHCFARA
jgi:hypothetical protein